MEVDIHRIIDEAIEKKDRSVSIFIGKDCTSINVYPYEDKLEEWIPIENEILECPQCGSVSKWITPYCSTCGTHLRAPSRKEKENDQN